MVDQTTQYSVFASNLTLEELSACNLPDAQLTHASIGFTAGSPAGPQQRYELMYNKDGSGVGKPYEIQVWGGHIDEVFSAMQLVHEVTALSAPMQWPAFMRYYAQQPLTKEGLAGMVSRLMGFQQQHSADQPWLVGAVNVLHLDYDGVKEAEIENHGLPQNKISIQPYTTPAVQ